MRVANIDMTDPNQQCPPGFNLRTDVRSCDRSDTGDGCTPITFPSHGIEYRQVCGRIRAYQYGSTYAFYNYYYQRSITIEDIYVYGMSLTHGRHPRQHIWTFASAYSEYYSKHYVCPCTRTDQPYTGAVPPFIGEDYFCDTAVKNMPFFYRTRRFYKQTVRRRPTVGRAGVWSYQHVLLLQPSSMVLQAAPPTHHR